MLNRGSCWVEWACRMSRHEVVSGRGGGLCVVGQWRGCGKGYAIKILIF